MRRIVRGIGWLMTGVLLAVCLAASVAWVAGGQRPFALTRIARTGWPGAESFDVFEAVGVGGGASISFGRIRNDRTGLAFDAWYWGPWLWREPGWRAGRTRDVPDELWTPRVTGGRGRWRVARWGDSSRPRAAYGWTFRAPLWAVVVISGAWPVTSFMLAGRRWRRRRRAMRKGLCPACGYDWRATPGRCPECGRGRGEADVWRMKDEGKVVGRRGLA
jgi:hypothetical protein